MGTLKNKYLKVYSGGKPEFLEDDVFKLILPIKGQIDDTHQDTHQGDSIIDRLLKYCMTPKSRMKIQGKSNEKVLKQ